MKTFRIFMSGGLSLLGFVTDLIAQPTPRFEPLELLNREVVLRFVGTDGLGYRVDVSTNLPRWDPLVTFVSAGVVRYTDTAAPYCPARIYRAQQLEGAGVLTGDHLPTADGDVLIHPIRHATFLMRWHGLHIYNDPAWTTAYYQGLPKADLILIGHEHNDHYVASVLSALTNSSTRIVATPNVFGSLPAGLKGITTQLTNGGSTSAFGLTIQAVPAYNTTRNSHLKGIGNGYVLTIGGRRIYISGDTEDTVEMRALRGIDVSFLAMNQPYTMSVSQAVSAVRAFLPRVAYPYHYGNVTPVTDVNSFKQEVGTGSGVEVRLRNWY
jgi:L-ascorbate metabolism protein UlaG (beta-lactamase superfamily)